MSLLSFKLESTRRALRLLATEGEVNVSRLTREAGSSVFYQRILPILIEKGFVESERKRVGRRTVRIIRITEKGLRLLRLLDEVADP